MIDGVFQEESGGAYRHVRDDMDHHPFPLPAGLAIFPAATDNPEGGHQETPQRLQSSPQGYPPLGHGGGLLACVYFKCV
jgi:hypothetical protein